MSATPPIVSSPAETSQKTLGDLLYADPSVHRTPESEWVALVTEIASGNARALRALFDRSHRLVFMLTMRLVNDRHTAEELTLDVFFDVWRRACSYKPSGGTVVGWLMNQARSRAIDRLRYLNRLKRDHSQIVRISEDQLVPDAGRKVEMEQQAQRLRHALTCLNRDERLAIEKAFFSGLSHAEVAANLDEPLGTVKTRIRSGLMKLREKFDSDEGNR